METIVLVHGFGSSSRAWQPQRDGLGDRFAVVTPDLPGHGNAPGPFDMESAVDVVAGHLDGGAHLVGISGGGTVALLAALRRPEAIASLLVSAPVARPPGFLRVQRTVMRLAPARLLGTALKRLYAGDNPDYADVAVEDFFRCGKPTLMSALRSIARQDIVDDIAGITAPTLVTVGDKDGPNHAPSRLVADTISAAELRMIPGAGHLWNIQFPELFNETLAAFVGDHSPG